MDLTALIQELGIDKLPADQQQRIITTSLQTIHRSVGLRLQETLTDEEEKQLETVIKERGEAAAIEEMAKMHPEIALMYQEEVDKLKEDLKAILPQ